jgi:hypothetical protein
MGGRWFQALHLWCPVRVIWVELECGNASGGFLGANEASEFVS